MFWPLILPFQITFVLFVLVVLFATGIANRLEKSRIKYFLLSVLIGGVAFVPSCAGIAFLLDPFRFGIFEYEQYSEVNDFRIERFLPPGAEDITLEKFVTGHRARYKISEEDLLMFLDGLWDDYGDFSVMSREELDDGRPVSAEMFERSFDDLGWPAFDAIEYHTPMEADGGGATYYYDRATGTVYQDGGYW